jgi:predicted methyltransferase
MNPSLRSDRSRPRPNGPHPGPALRGTLPALGLALAAGVLAGCSSLDAAPAAPGTPPGARAPMAEPQIAEMLASPTRSAADRATDARRKPAQLLAFIGIRPGMVALDLSAGGGYTTELLARAIGPTGQVVGQSAPRAEGASAPAPAAPEGAAATSSTPEGAAAAPSPAPAASAPAPTPGTTVRRTSAQALAEREAALQAQQVAAAPITAAVRRFEDPVPAALADQQLDLVTLVYNYHDLGYMGVDRSAMNRAVFRALKPGGLYVIVDHAGRSGTGISESGTLHRIEQAFLEHEVEAAGFQRVGEAGFLRNTADPRDRNVPQGGQPKDGFVLKFVKPAQP